MPAGGVAAYLEPLPVGRLWGVGEKTAELLGRLAIRTVGDLGRTPPTILERLIGAAAASHLGALARGVDDRRVEPYEQPKSIGHEETFDRDLDDEDEILRELLALSGRVAARLREDGYRARTVTLKVRLANFTTLTRSRTQPDPTDLGGELHRTVSDLYRHLPGERRRVRLLGVQAAGLDSAGAHQLALLRSERWDDVERTVDRIERRFGTGAAGPASLLDRSPSPFGTTRSGPLSIIGGERGRSPRPEVPCRSTKTSRRSWRRSNGGSRKRIRGSSSRSPARTFTPMPGVG